MDYCILGKFQGAWLGSIIGEALAERESQSERTKIVQYQPQDWYSARAKIADILIKNKRLEVSYLSHQLEQIFLRDSVSKVNFVREAFSREMAWAEPDRIVLILLPLIIFYADNADHLDLVTEIVSQCNFEQTNIIEIQEDMSIWSYLLALALHDKFTTHDTNVSSIVKQVLAGVEVKTTSLVEKLEIVAQAWEHGKSLNKLTDELSNQGNPSQTAIALCFYCFASTPKDFMLSVKRAANLDRNMALATTALTGAISGAYNGLVGIPWNWNVFGNQNKAYQQARQAAKELFKTWLGIYSIENDQFPYDCTFSVVAPAKMIQPRESLNIISQR